MRDLTAGSAIATVGADDAAAIATAVRLLAAAIPPPCAGLVPYHAAGYPAFLTAVLRPPEALRSVVLRAIRVGPEVVAVADWRLAGSGLFLNGISVRDDHRGRGHGGRLLDDGVRIARRLGLSELELDVSVDNPARALYRRAGYRETGYAAWEELATPTGPPAGAAGRIVDWAGFEAHRTAYGFGDVTLRDPSGTSTVVRVVGTVLRLEAGPRGVRAGRVLAGCFRPSRAYTIRPLPAPADSGCFACFARMRLALHGQPGGGGTVQVPHRIAPPRTPDGDRPARNRTPGGGKPDRD